MRSAHTIASLTGALFAIAVITAVMYGLTILPSKATAVGGQVFIETPSKALHESTSNVYNNVLINVGGASAPSANVTVNLSGDAQCKLQPIGGSGYGSSVQYVYDPIDQSAWPSYAVSMARVQPVDDLADEGQHTCKISFTTSSSDSAFNNITGNQTFTVNDNDNVAVEYYQYGTLPTALKEGEPTHVQIASSGEPTADVKYNYKASGNCQVGDALSSGKGGGAPLTYKNFASTKTLTHGKGQSSIIMYLGILATDDSTYNPGSSCTISANISSSDTRYTSLNAPSKTFSITENDSASSTGGTDNPSTPDSTDDEDKKDEESADDVVKDTGVTIVNAKGEAIDTSTVFSINPDEELVFEGNTKPKNTVTITVYSEPKEFSTEADENGDYRIVVSGLPEGEHHAELAITDADTGETTEPQTIAQFSVGQAQTSLSGNDDSGATEEAPTNNNLVLFGGAGIAAIAMIGLLIKSRMKPLSYLRHLMHH